MPDNKECKFYFDENKCLGEIDLIGDGNECAK